MSEQALLPEYSLLLGAELEEFEKIGEISRRLLSPKEGVDYAVDLSTEPELREGEELIAKTLSMCSECTRLLNAIVFGRRGKVWIRKVCPEHGEVEELYWGDYELYRRFREWQAEGRGNLDTQVGLEALCPYNCGLCPRHKSQPALVNLVATNRCDLSCWYCFFYAEKMGYVYEPTLEHIRYVLREARRSGPVRAKALQITGGEPLLRDDVVEIVRIAKEEGFTHVQVNTTGIRLAFDAELARALREAGTNVVYMSFDGVTPFTNPKNHWEVPYALDNLRKAGLGVVLVPTVIRGVNDGELWDIVEFALENTDIVRGVNFQPVSLTGRLAKSEREALRITIPDVLAEIERQSGGIVKREDWYPVPSVVPISRFVEALTGAPQLEFTTHFACGAATYLFKDGEEVVPITRFVDVEEFFRYLAEKALEIERGKSKYLVLADLALRLRKFVDLGEAPKSLKKGRKILRLIYEIFVKHDYRSLGEFHYNALFLGIMHFQDRYNHDVARVQRCCIFYAMPDGRLVPFCSFNVVPELYRDRVQRAFGIPLAEWEKIRRERIASRKYKRDLVALLRGEPYRRHYAKFFDPDSIPLEKHLEASARFGIPVSRPEGGAC